MKSDAGRRLQPIPLIPGNPDIDRIDLCRQLRHLDSGVATRIAWQESVAAQSPRPDVRHIVAAINPSEKCQQCKFMNACGGAYLPHRFSRKNGYDNPSVCCDDLYSMFENMQSVLESHTKSDGERLDTQDALAGAS